MSDTSHAIAQSPNKPAIDNLSLDNSPLATNISLCDALDRILTKGVVAYGDISISVAGVDLLYIGLRGLVCAIDALGELPQSLKAVQPPTSAEYAQESSADKDSGQ